MLGSIWFINFLTRKFIGEKHLVLDELTRGEIPEHWSQKFKGKYEKFNENGQQDKVVILKKEASKIYMKKLNSIGNYIQKTNLVENEETRSEILSDLEQTRTKWLGSISHEA